MKAAALIRVLFLYLAIVIPLASSPSALAQSTAASAQLDRLSGSFPGAINETILNPTESITRHIEDSYGSATTYGNATYGALKASATASGDAPGYGAFSAHSQVMFSDTFLIGSSGLTGQVGTMSFDLWYERSLDYSGSSAWAGGYASTSIQAGTNLGTMSYSELLIQPCPFCIPALQSQLNGQDAIVLPTLVEFTAPIAFGIDSSLVAILDTQTYAVYYDAPGSAFDGASSWLADASHSLYWGGIKQVTDSEGNVVDYSITSASGTDYRQSFIPSTTAPVPEPDTYALMMAGLGVLGAAARRGKNAQIIAAA